MNEWFGHLAAPLAIYYLIAFAATLVLLLLLLLTLLGVGDHDVGGGNLDGGGAGGAMHADGLHIFSVRAVVAFFVGFGWAGAGALEGKQPLLIAIPISLGIGAIFMGTVYGMMRLLWNLRASGTLNYQNAIGEVATVYVPIPPNQSGAGQVQVMIQGRLATVQAFSRAKKKLSGNSRVKVVGVVDSHTLLVDVLKTDTADSKNHSAAPPTEPKEKEAEE